VLAYVVILLSMMWLSVVEGGQASLVGLPPVRKEIYKDSHPITHRITSIAHRDDNLNKYLIGRQFLVVLIVFVMNLAGSPLEDADVLGLPHIFQQVFLSFGLALILMSAMIGQLAAQVNASHCMLDFINTYSMLLTLFVTLAIEFSGLLHSSYLVEWTVGKLAGKPASAALQPRGILRRMFFVGRVAISVFILGFAFAVTTAALYTGKTTMWPGVPNTLSVFMFIFLMCIVGMLEGAQIAFFAVSKLKKKDVGTNPVVVKTFELLFEGSGHNLPGFMIGRQILVTMNFFIIARITTLNVDPDSGDTIFGVSQGVQHFFNTGLLGAIITTTIGSITWQLVASAFPIAFLSNPLVYVLLRICLFLECTGICAGAWVLASMYGRVAGFKRDEVYLDRAAEDAEKDDEVAQLDGGPTTSEQPTILRVPSLGVDSGTFNIDIDPIM